MSLLLIFNRKVINIRKETFSLKFYQMPIYSSISPMQIFNLHVRYF